MNTATAEKVNDTVFVTVPETTLPGGIVVPAFQVGQFLTGRRDGKLVIAADVAPMVRVSYHKARELAASAGYQLIKETQALALAYQIAIQPENWTGGAIGKGKLYQGLRKWNVNSAQPANVEPNDPDERRWFVLTGGQKIWDAAGNAYTWVFDDVQGDERGLIAKPFASDSPSIVIPYPNYEKGQGWTPSGGSDWSGRALLRGGCWRSRVYAGVFLLARGWPGGEYDDVGFRCTKGL